MKLYNLFEEIILEEKSLLLTEGVSDEQVIDAIKNKYRVKIWYNDPTRKPSDPPSERYIEIYNYGDTMANNGAIRAYQVGGQSTTTRGGAWKLFRLDRIVKWQPTKVHWKDPISDPNRDPSAPKYNQSGDRSMRHVYNKIDVNPNLNPPKKSGASRELTDKERQELMQTKP